MKTLRVLSVMMVLALVVGLLASCAPPTTPVPAEEAPPEPTEAPPEPTEAPPEVVNVFVYAHVTTVPDIDPSISFSAIPQKSPCERRPSRAQAERGEVASEKALTLNLGGDSFEQLAPRPRTPG